MEPPRLNPYFIQVCGWEGSTATFNNSKTRQGRKKRLFLNIIFLLILTKYDKEFKVQKNGCLNSIQKPIYAKLFLKNILIQSPNLS